MPDELDERGRRLVDDLAGTPLPGPASLRQRVARRRHRRIGTAALALLAVVAIVAVAVATSRGHTGVRVTAGPTTSTTTTTATPATPSTRCRTGQLRLASGSYGEAGPMFGQTFTFTNTSPTACWVRGWPRLQLEGAAGEPEAVPTETVRQNAAPAPAFVTVVLRPGGTASFDVYNAVWDARTNHSCPETSAVYVTPPGSSVALRVAVRMPDCPFSFDIAPLIAGSTDRQAWSEEVG